MATLEKIRSHSGLLIGAIALALLCFVVGDALNNSSNLFNSSRTRVGKVEGETLSYEDFQKQVSVMTSVLKDAGRSASDEDVRTEVWNSFVQTSVLKKISEETGLCVPPAELKEALFSKENYHPMLRSIPLLYQNNQFKPEIAIAIINAMDTLPELKAKWLFWENRLKDQMLIDKVQYFAANAMSAPKAMVDFLDKMNCKTVKVVCAAKEYRTLPDSLYTPTEADKRRKYDEIKELYKTDGVRYMKAIVYNVVPTEDDRNQTAEKVKYAESELKTISEEELPYFISQESDVDYPYNPSYLSENNIAPALRAFAFSAKKDSVIPTFEDGQTFKTAKVLSDVVVRPDSVKASIIIVGGKTLDEIKSRGDSLLKVLKAGADFTETAIKHSVDPNVRQNLADMGWVREGQFGLDTFDHVLFKSKVGEISKLETENGVFILKVTDMTAPVKKVRIAVVSNKVLPSSTTYHSVFEAANLFIANNRTKDQFENSAKENNLLVREMGPITENQVGLYGLENSRPIVKWVFEAENGEVSSKPFDCKNQYLIGYLSDVVEKGYFPFSNTMVQERVSYLVRNDMKAKELMETMKDVSDLSSVGTPDTFNLSFGDLSIPRYGAEPAVIAAAYKAEANQIVSPIKGENGVFAFKVIESQEADSSYVSVGTQMKNNVRSYVSYRLFNSLMNQSDKMDNRSRFY